MIKSFTVSSPATLKANHYSGSKKSNLEILKNIASEQNWDIENLTEDTAYEAGNIYLFIEVENGKEL